MVRPTRLELATSGMTEARDLGDEKINLSIKYLTLF
jgi:hypothetical protein